MLRDTLEYIAQNYLQASSEPFTNHPVANHIRQEAPRALSEVIGNRHYLIKGSAGQSRWADVPWLAILDPNITQAATKEYYIVYLFSADMKRVYLCLGQASTQVEEEFKSGTYDELRRRAALMRARLKDANSRFTTSPVELNGATSLAQSYEPGVAFAIPYQTNHLPSEDRLQEDLRMAVKLYARLVARGGRDSFEEASDNEATNTAGQTVDERRRYKYHRKIERSAKAARLAKDEHGFVCQCCGFDFEKTYGEIGKEYIEAHHLTPLSELPEDVPVTLDPKTDFAVLCANCHRMIHRKVAPKTIAGLKALMIK